MHLIATIALLAIMLPMEHASQLDSTIVLSISEERSRLQDARYVNQDILSFIATVFSA